MDAPFSGGREAVKNSDAKRTNVKPTTNLVLIALPGKFSLIFQHAKYAGQV
jgi:hypothetical protein